MTDQDLNELGVQQRRVLEIVWERNGATVQDVLDKLNAESDKPNLAYTTILATMQKLEKSGWLRHEQSNRAYVYKATQSRRQAIGTSLRTFVETFLGGNKMLLFQHFVEDTPLSEDELNEIRAMIKKKAKK
ncbi:transcriptional regulator [Planctomycetales bacterium]|nr:transcriptional regulator [Planctomycetales bacterium]